MKRNNRKHKTIAHCEQAFKFNKKAKYLPCSLSDAE